MSSSGAQITEYRDLECEFFKGESRIFPSFWRKNHSDVLCLQELKLQTDAVDQSLLTERGYDHLAIHGQKQ